MTYHGDESADEERHGPLFAMEEFFRAFQIPLVQEEILPHFQDHRLAPVIAHEVGKQRADDRTEARHEDGHPEIPLSIGHLKSDEGHHGFAGHWCDHAFQAHEEPGASVTSASQNLYGQVRNFFSDHANRASERRKRSRGGATILWRPLSEAAC